MLKLKKPSHRMALALALGTQLALGLSACQDAPKQYDNTPAPANTKAAAQNQLRIKAVPEIQSSLKLDSNKTENNDKHTESDNNSVADKELNRQKAIENSQKPILYGVGAAGVTFDDTFDQAKLKLEAPKPGSPILNGGLNEYAYDNGAYIFFRPDSPTLVQLIALTTAYQGSLDAGPELGKLTTHSDLSAFFPDTDAKPGLTLARKLFIQLEHADPSFDCIKEHRCSVVNALGGAQYVIVLPRASFFISADRKVLFQIQMSAPSKKGGLDREFDLFKGAFSGPDAATGKNGTIFLGENWGEANAKIGGSVPTNDGTTSFTKDFDSIIIGMTKSNHNWDYKEPSANETLLSATLTDPNKYSYPLKFNDKYVELKLDPNGHLTDVQLSPALAPDTDQLKALTLSPAISSSLADQTKLLQSLKTLLTAELKAMDPKAIVYSSLSGFDKDSRSRSFVLNLITYSMEKKSGLSITLLLREQDGRILAETNLLNDPADSVILPALLQSTPIAAHQLAGFSIGQQVILTNLDRARNEADLDMKLGPDQIPYHQHVDYFDTGMLSYAADNGTPSVHSSVHDYKVLTKRQVIIQNVGDFPVLIGLTIPPKAPGVPAVDPVDGLDGKGPVQATITSISVGSSLAGAGGVTGLCGDPSLNAVPGEPFKVFQARLDKVLPSLIDPEGFNRCPMIYTLHGGGNGQIDQAYFGSMNLVLSMSDKAALSTDAYPGSVEQDITAITLYSSDASGVSQ